MESAVQAYQEGGIIAYPTEAVFGLGCDPTNQAAVEKLLSIKQRPIEKGLILLAANYSQLLPFVDDSLIPQDKRFSVLSRWPDGITQVLPAKADVPTFLTGKFSSIAVRVTSQPDVVALCNEVNGPIVSTSANLTGHEPARTASDVKQNLGELVDFIVEGDTLGFTQPSKIIDGLTGEVFRT